MQTTANSTTVLSAICLLLPVVVGAEPERDHWRWEFYDRNCAELEARGMNYAVYPWLHFAPHWAMESELWEPLVSLKNGKTTYAPSIWSPRTMALFDRFYGALRKHFGTRVREVFIGMIADYGEVGYPIGMADWVVPAPYHGADYWCGDPLARADFRRVMLARYGSLVKVNAAWGTDWTSTGQIDYPPWTATEGPLPDELAKLSATQRGQARRRWLDFLEWYLDAMVEFTGKVSAVVARHYPEAPREIKIGFGSERCMYGADYTHYVSRSRADGYTVRSTHGKLPPYFYRRFSTAAKHYKVPLVTEPPAEVSRDEEVERIFKDATSGTTEYMDYPGNVLAATDLFARYAAYLEGQHSLTEVAFYFPTTDHRLRAGQSLPPRLLTACDASREWFDWDLVDERLVQDGALASYRTLLLPEGTVFERDMLDRLSKWVAQGGLLIAADNGPIETVEGDTAPAAALFVDRGTLPSADDVYRAVAQPLPAWRLDIGGKNDESLLTGDWNNREGGGQGTTTRWTGANSSVWLPVDPTQTYELALWTRTHPRRRGKRQDVLVNGVKVGVLADGAGAFRVVLTPEVLAGHNPSRLTFVVDGWKPSEIEASTDQRTLGVSVDWIQLWRSGDPEPTIPPAPRITHAVAGSGVARCLRRVGRGATLLLPTGDAGMKTFVAVAAHVLAEPESLLPGHAAMPRFGTAADGVWTALLPGRVLLVNRTDRPQRRAIELDPTVLKRLGAAAPAERKVVTVKLAAHSLASVELPSGAVVVP